MPIDKCRNMRYTFFIKTSHRKLTVIGKFSSEIFPDIYNREV